MNYKSYPIGVHVNENSVKVLEGIVQHDNGNLFQIQLYDGTEAFDFSGYSVINAAIIRPDETPLADIWTAITAEQADNGEQSVIADEDTTGDVESHTFLAIQYLDPKNGRITLQVGGEATAQVGMNRMVLEIYSDDVVLTTARINYNVVETANKVSASILQNSGGYAALQDLLTECASIIDAERERGNQEAIRREQETARQASVGQMLSDLNEYVSTLSANLEIAQEAAVTSQSWAQSSQAIAIADLPQALQDAINAASASAATINGLTQRLTALEAKTARLSLASETGYIDIPTTDDLSIANYFSAHTTAGALVLNTDDGALYVGTGSGSYTMVKDPDAFPGYIASAEAPTNTDALWVDTANGGLLKYYNGSEWTEMKSIAVFG